MLASITILHISTLLLSSTIAYAAPYKALEDRAVTALSTTQISAFKPISLYAAAVFCNPASTLTWTCGPRCAASPNFKPVATGGNGDTVQNWLVGYDPNLNTVIVAHQGTNPESIASILTDADFVFDTFDKTLFPNIPKAVKAHNGFLDAHAETAPAVLAAVTQAMSQFSTKSVTITGHSLGAALSLIEAIHLPLHLPADTIFTTTIYGSPRVGNQAFADYVDAHVTNFSRINNKKDVVPIVPPRLLGFRHPSGEIHISSTDSWNVCSGQDSKDKACSTGLVKNIFSLFSNPDDHVGPYDGVSIGFC